MKILSILKFTATLVVLLLPSTFAQGGDLIRLERDEAQSAQVILENTFYRMAIDPARGATAVSLIVKPANQQMLLPDATHAAGMLADVFRDQGFVGEWRGAYDVDIQSTGPAEGKVRFTHRGVGSDVLQQVVLTKTLAVTADSPAIDVTIDIHMTDGENRHFPFRYWVHNRIGCPQGTTRYFLPALKGIETFTFSPGAIGSSQQHTVTDPPRAWLAAMADDSATPGVAVRFDEPLPQTYYSYAKNKIVTVEWGRDQYVLRRGNTWTSHFTIQTFAGLPHVDGVVARVVGAIVADDAEALRGRVLLTGASGAYDVRLQYCRLPDRTWTPLGDTKVLLRAGNVSETPFDLRDVGEGSFIVKAQLFHNQTALGEFERHIIIGESSGRYALMPLTPRTDQLGKTNRTAAIALQPDKPVPIEKVMPQDCRLVRGFTHAPVDGRIDTRNTEGGIAEWNGVHGVPAVNYREFNDNDGLHITLPDGGFDTMIIRGGWTGRIYGDQNDLLPPGADVVPFREVTPHVGSFRTRVERGIAPRKLSFFCEKPQVGPLADVTFLRVQHDRTAPAPADAVLTMGEAVQVSDKLHEAIEARFGPFYRAHQLGATPSHSVMLAKGEFLHLITPPQDTSLGIGAVRVVLHITDVEAGALLTLRIQDPLDPRRAIMEADFQVAGPGTYHLSMDVPDQVFLSSQVSSRLDGPIAPPPQVWLSLAFDAPAELAQADVALEQLPRDRAIAQAGAWRKFLLKGLFSAMSEPRPWMNLTDKGPIREQIAASAAMNRYATSLIELLETAEIARLLLPDDDVVRQYHEWLYQHMDRRKPLPPPQITPSDDPRWAVLVRQSYRELRDIAQWWLDHRMTEGGYFGGGINDDTDLFQTWQCLPMIESSPLGSQLKDAAAQLADSAWRLTLDEGINKRSMDALHAYEEGINQLALCARWFYGDPVHFERLMICADSTMKLMVEMPDGRVHFGSEWLGIDQARHGFDQLGSAGGYATKLFTHPLYEVAWYNRNPAALRRFEQWGRTWQAYQQPGAYVEHVDITTGKPHATTLAARGPTDEWLALYQITDDPAWLEPIKLGMQSESYWGFGASYGRSAHAMASWDEPAQTTLRERHNGEGAGYAGFFLNQDRKLLERWLADSASWFGRYRHMHTAAEQKTDRVLNYNASTPIACYLGDAPNRNRWVNFTAVSYEGLRGDDYAALVWDAGNNRLKVALYNFTDKALTGNLRTWRLDHGRYRVRIGADTDDDGSIDIASIDREQVLLRGSSLPLQLPPKQVTVVTIAQLEKLDDIRTRSDLALAAMETKVEGDRVTGVVHNIGAAAADVVIAVIDEHDNIVAEKSWGSLEAPLDLKPRRLTFTLNIPGGMRNGLRLAVDPASKVAEINETNNTVSLAPQESAR